MNGRRVQANDDAHREGFSDLNRLRDAAGFDQEVVKLASLGQIRDLLKQVGPEGAADAAWTGAEGRLVSIALPDEVHI